MPTCGTKCQALWWCGVKTCLRECLCTNKAGIILHNGHSDLITLSVCICSSVCSVDTKRVTVGICYVQKQQQISGICSTLCSASLCLIAFMSVMSESETLTSIAGVIISSSDRSRSVEDRSLTLHAIIIAIYVLLYDIWWHVVGVMKLHTSCVRKMFGSSTRTTGKLCSRGWTTQELQNRVCQNLMFCSLKTQTVLLP